MTPRSTSLATARTSKTVVNVKCTLSCVLCQQRHPTQMCSGLNLVDSQLKVDYFVQLSLVSPERCHLGITVRPDASSYAFACSMRGPAPKYLMIIWCDMIIGLVVLKYSTYYDEIYIVHSFVK